MRRGAHTGDRVSLAELPLPLEEDIQRAYFDIIRAHTHIYPELEFLFAVPNGGHRHGAVAKKMWGTGTRAGVPDVLWPCRNERYVGMAIEFKRPPKKPTPAQYLFLEHLKRHGWYVDIHFDAEQAWKVTRAYLLNQL